MEEEEEEVKEESLDDDHISSNDALESVQTYDAVPGRLDWRGRDRNEKPKADSEMKTPNQSTTHDDTE